MENPRFYCVECHVQIEYDIPFCNRCFNMRHHCLVDIHEHDGCTIRCNNSNNATSHIFAESAQTLCKICDEKYYELCAHCKIKLSHFNVYLPQLLDNEHGTILCPVCNLRAKRCRVCDKIFVGDVFICNNCNDHQHQNCQHNKN